MTLSDVRLPSLHFSWKEAPSSTSLAGGLVNTALRKSQFHQNLKRSPGYVEFFFSWTTGRCMLTEYLGISEHAHSSL